MPRVTLRTLKGFSPAGLTSNALADSGTPSTTKDKLLVVDCFGTHCAPGEYHMGSKSRARSLRSKMALIYRSWQEMVVIKLPAAAQGSINSKSWFNNSKAKARCRVSASLASSGDDERNNSPRLPADMAVRAINRI